MAELEWDATNWGQGDTLTSTEWNNHITEGHETLKTDQLITSVIENPDVIMQSELDDTESAELAFPVPDTETVTVYRWGGFDVANQSAPTDLDVELLDGSDTVQATANTIDNSNTSGVASHQNTSGSTSIFKLRVKNDTGSTITQVGAIFGWLVA